MELSLSGKRAIVTGGSSGIGLAVAHGLHAEGARVVLAARDEAALRRAREGFPAGPAVLIQATDTTSQADVDDLARRVDGEWGGADVLVNAAAAPATPGAASTLEHLADEDLRREVETKVLGYLRVARALAPQMKRAGWGRIVNIAGLSARTTGSPFGTIRNVAVAALTKNLADELGPAGINVTAVHPGFTVTERTAAVVDQIAQRRGISSAEAAQQLAAGSTLGRLVSAQEVADVVVFLASPRSVAINGDAIGVGGGAPGSIYY